MKRLKSLSGLIITAAAVYGSVGLVDQAVAQDPCACEASLCNPQGFVVTLTTHQVDQLNGTSTWTYEICNQPEICYCDEEYQNVQGKCRGLSHIDVSLPGLGSCLTPTQSVSFAQVGGVVNAMLECGVGAQDPSCDVSGTPGSDFVAKCNVAENNDLDPGECVTMQLSIAGETPTLGKGAASTVTKAGNACTTDAICGPACDCGGDSEQSCLTRSPGFWGHHPAIAEQYLPITVCGVPLTTTSPATCSSVTEALCVSPGLEANRKLDRNPAYAQLVRQLAAAKLNLAASAANGGSCESQLAAARIAQCEALCGANKTVINKSDCIADLDEFNNSLDTFAVTPPPFDAPGSADPGPCQGATGNSIVINKKCL